MRKIEIGLICSVVFAITWKLLGYPFHNMLTVISVLALSSFYFYLGFPLFNGVRFRKIVKKESYKGISALRVVGSVGLGMILSTLLIGILFRVMMWPGASSLLIFGVVSLILALIISFVKLMQKKSEFYPKVFLRSIVYTAIGVSLFFSKHLFLELGYADYPEYIEVVKKLEKDPYNLELQKQEEELHSQIYYNRTGKRN